MPQFPYGDAYLFQTPKSDRVGDLLLQQQRQRDIDAQRQNQQLDTEFARNVSGIKDADIPELTQKWGEYKQAKMNLYKNGNKMSNDERIQKELDAQRKLGAAYGVINSSKEDLAAIKAHAVGVAKDTKGLYADDARQKLSQWTSTPTSQRDKTKDGEIFYPYSVPNLDAELKNARGTQKEVPLVLGQSQTDPLKDDKEIYKVGNNPNQFYNNLLGSIVSTNKGRNFTGLINHSFSDAELEDLQNKYYAKVNDPKYVAVYGPPQEFPESSNTDLGKAVKIQTMKEVVDAPLVPVRKVSELNADRSLAAHQKFSKEQQQRGFDQAKRMAFLNDKLIKGRKSDGTVDEETVGYPTQAISEEYGEPIDPVSLTGTSLGTKGAKRIVYADKIPTKTLSIINPTDRNKDIYPVEPIEVMQPDGKFRKAFYIDENNNLIGKENRKIGADDARDLYIKEVVPNKYKLNVNTRKATTAPPTKTKAPSGIKWK